MDKPTEEQRQQVIDVMTRAFTNQGMEPADAAKAAELFTDEAIQRGES